MKVTMPNMQLKPLSWQDVIDMYHDQELQKIQEEKEMKEKAYYDQKSKERKVLWNPHYQGPQKVNKQD